MLLVIDVGNTNIVFGIYKENILIKTFRVKTKKDYSVNEFELILKIKDIKAVIISSVVSGIMNNLKKAIKNKFSLTPIVVGQDVECEIKNLYENPKQTGIDRLINAKMASLKYPLPLIVIDFGTATTFNVVNSKGEFLGGAIFTGLNVLSNVLNNRTAKLPKVDFVKPNEVIGKSTIECMHSGIYYGYLSAIEGILSVMKQNMKGNGTVIATGGLSKLIFENSNFIDIIDETLILDGLKYIYDTQSGGKNE